MPDPITGIAAIGTGASMISGNKAAKAQQQAANAANDTQWAMYNQTRADMAPFREGGLQAWDAYLANLGIVRPSTQPATQPQPAPPAAVAAGPASGPLTYDDWWAQNGGNYSGEVYANPNTDYLNYLARAVAAPQQPAAQQPAQPPTQTQTPAQVQQNAFAAFRATPGYQFGLDEGQKALERSMAARGMFNSGATGKALVRFGQNYADQQGYGPYMNRLAAAAGIGQTTTQQMGSFGAQTAGNAGNALMAAGNARASGYANMGSSINAGINNALFAYGINQGGGNAPPGYWGIGQSPGWGVGNWF